MVEFDLQGLVNDFHVASAVVGLVVGTAVTYVWSAIQDRRTAKRIVHLQRRIDMMSRQAGR